MTAPIQPLPVPNVTAPYVPAPPNGAQAFNQAGGDLAKVLMALRQLSQTSQLENRQLDVQRELGMGNIGVQTLQENRLRDQNTTETNRLSQTGAALRPLLGGYPSTTSVADANLPATVESLGKVKELGKKDKADLGTTDMQNYAEYQQLLKNGETDKAAEFRKLFLEKQPGVTVNVGGENKHSQALAEADVGFYKTAVETANSAIQLMPSISNAANLVDKSFTGAGANAKLGLSRVLSTFGVKSSGDQAADTQTLKRLAQENTLAFLGTRALGSGTAVSDKDREYMQSLSGENITLEPTTLKRIFRINYGTQIMKVQEAIKEIRQQAIDYPSDAAQLNARAGQLERGLQPSWVKYGDMLKAEGMQEKQQKAKDAQDADRILRQRKTP